MLIGIYSIYPIIKESNFKNNGDFSNYLICENSLNKKNKEINDFITSCSDFLDDNNTSINTELNSILDYYNDLLLFYNKTDKKNIEIISNIKSIMNQLKKLIYNSNDLYDKTEVYGSKAIVAPIDFDGLNYIDYFEGVSLILGCSLGLWIACSLAFSYLERIAFTFAKRTFNV